VLAEGAFVEAGDGGVEAIESVLGGGRETIDGGEELAMVGVDLFGQSEIARADAVAGGFQGGVECFAGHVLGFEGAVAGDEFFGDDDGTGEGGGDSGVGFRKDGGGIHGIRGWDAWEQWE